MIFPGWVTTGAKSAVSSSWVAPVRVAVGGAASPAPHRRPGVELDERVAVDPGRPGGVAGSDRRESHPGVCHTLIAP